MIKKLPAIFLLLFIVCGCCQTACAKHKKQPVTTSDALAGDFDYFLLTLSWAPEFCERNPNGRKSAECASNQHRGLGVHGLWPQYNDERAEGLRQDTAGFVGNCAAYDAHYAGQAAHPT